MNGVIPHRNAEQLKRDAAGRSAATGDDGSGCGFELSPETIREARRALLRAYASPEAQIRALAQALGLPALQRRLANLEQLLAENRRRKASDALPPDQVRGLGPPNRSLKRPPGG